MGNACGFCRRNWKSLLMVLPVVLTLGLLLRQWMLAQQFAKAQRSLRKLEADRATKQRLITEHDESVRTRLATEYEEKRKTLQDESNARELVLDKDRDAFADQMNKLWNL